MEAIEYYFHVVLFVFHDFAKLNFRFFSLVFYLEILT